MFGQMQTPESPDRKGSTMKNNSSGPRRGAGPIPSAISITTTVARPPESLIVAPGKSVLADPTVLTATPGSAGSWPPTQLLTIAPNDTTVIALSWPPDTSVLRQDGAPIQARISAYSTPTTDKPAVRSSPLFSLTCVC
jgi:hypothetical protein